MKKKITELKERFRTAGTAQLREIDKEMDNLAKADEEAFSKAMVSAAKDTVAGIEQESIRQKLNSILPVVSVSYLSKTYFGKTPQWFYQRLNENDVNGKPARFTDKEIEKLSFALKDISLKMSYTASCIF